MGTGIGTTGLEMEVMEDATLDAEDEAADSTLERTDAAEEKALEAERMAAGVEDAVTGAVGVL